MYSVNDLVVYDNTGVCKIDGITKIKNIKGIDKKQEYYILRPVYQDGTIYTPVNTDVFMRPILTKDEAMKLIEVIPTIETEAYHNKSIQQLVEHYKDAFKTHSFEDLLELLKSIYNKKQFVEQQKKKFGQVDERFMKRAEDLVFGEFAAVFDIEKDDVPDFIAKKLEELQTITK